MVCEKPGKLYHLYTIFQICLTLVLKGIREDPHVGSCPLVPQENRQVLKIGKRGECHVGWTCKREGWAGKGRETHESNAASAKYRLEKD